MYYLTWLLPFAEALIFLVFEVLYQLELRREDPVPNLDSFRVISEEEFHSRVVSGENLWVFDNLVLDLTNYWNQHPGGAFLMKQTVGRDISKFFYGAYSLTGNVNVRPGQRNHAHAHSNIARKVMYRHIVGVT